MKITFLGGGNMAAALIGGMLERGFAAGDIQVVELGADARERLSGRFGVRAVESFDAAALACDVVLLAVKPQQMKAALAPLAGRLSGQLVISIAAGLRVARNRPYAGGHITERHGRPETGSHALQLELRRGLFMHESTHEPNDGFAGMQALLGELVRMLAVATTELGAPVAMPAHPALSLA